MGALLLLWFTALTTHTIGLTTTHSDFSIWYRVARDWSRGLGLYTQTYDHKTPTLFMFHRLMADSWPELSFYLIETCLVALAAFALVLVLRARGLRVPLLAGVLFVIWSGEGPTNIVGQIIEAIASPLDVLGICAFWFACRDGNRLLALIGGICFALMIALRVPCAGLGLVWLLVLHESPGKSSWRGPRMAVWASGGVLLVFLLAVLHGLAQGYARPYMDVFALDVAYAGTNDVPLGTTVAYVLVSLWVTFFKNQLAFVLCLLSAVELFRGRLGQASRSVALMATIWFVAGIITAVPGNRHYGHYYHVLWPSVALGACLWLEALMDRSRESRLGARLAVFVGCLAWGLSLSASVPRWIRYRTLLEAGGHPSQKCLQVVRKVESRTQVDDPVAVCVLDNEWAELLWRIDRPSVTRLVCPASFLRSGAHPPILREWVEAMIEHPPPLIVTDGKALPYPGSAPLERTLDPRLQDLVQSRYSRVFRLDDLVILALTDR